MEHMNEIFSYLLDWRIALFLPLGVVVGIIVGAIPGLTATMTIGLLLPFTFAFSPLVGFVLLIGIFKGALFGGSIIAILLKCPGTPAAACTMIDGYPLAQQGRAKLAINVALWASFLGDLMATVVLITIAGTIAKIGLKFGPAEYFALILFSVTIIAAVSDTGITRGLIAGALGLLFGTIGLDLVYSTPRFMFEYNKLTEGLSLVPLLVGLFALPSIIMHYISPERDDLGQSNGSPADLSGESLGFPTLAKILPTIGKSGAIGMCLGAIPGIGATVSSFIAYGVAKRSAPDRDDYGKGAISGVAAAEAANSGNGGATLIPLLALGIPGDVVTAVLLAAFAFHGLAPGPMMFQTSLPLVHALFLAVLVSSFLVFLVGLISSGWIAKISKISLDTLYPIVLVLAVIGSFALTNTLHAVYVLIIAGIFGVFLHAVRIPAPAFLIGFVLSTLLEDNLRRTLLISGGDVWALLSGPISIGFHVLTVASVIAITFRQIKLRKVKRKLT